MELRHLWIIDDNAPDVVLAALAIRRAGLPVHVTVIPDSERAMEMIDGCGKGITTAPAVMLLDLNLPKVSGAEILRAVRGNRDMVNVKVAVVSSSPVSAAP